MQMIRLMACILMAAALPMACLPAAQDWGPAQFLVGHWTGEGSGQPGSGTGAFSFIPDVQGKVLIRRSFAEYPAAGGKPASRHDDLTVIYHDETTGELRAVYFDNEDHVIRYSGKASPGGVVFVSDGKPSEMRYRLTYTATGKDTLKLQFEVATPGHDFVSYLEANARRDQ
jgi:hypothetical protein